MATGHTPSRRHPEYFGGPHFWVTATDARPVDGGVINSTKETINDLGLDNSAAVILPKNTVCLSRTGGSIGYTIILGQPMATSQGFVNWICSDALNPWFLLHILMAERKALYSFAEGSAYKTIFFPEAKAFHICMPSRPEQDRIVAEIEKQFTRLEAGVAALKRIQVGLKRYRAAVLKAACEGRLAPTEAELARSKPRSAGSIPKKNAAPDFESGTMLLQRILAERRGKWQGRGKYREPAAPDTANLPAVPEGWTWATIEQLAAPEPNSITDGPFGSNLKTEHYMDSGPRVIRLQNIGDGVYVDEEAHISQAHFERLEKHRVFPNDVVIAAFGDNPPRSCIIPEALGPAIVKADCIRFKPHSFVMPKYMNAALNSDPVRKRTRGMVHGVGRPRLNLGEIRSIVLPVPPIAEQLRIVAEMERRLSVIDELEAVVTANTQRAGRLRQAILTRAFRLT